jgi:hypothetical protein
MYFLSKSFQSLILHYFFIFRNFANTRIPKKTAKNAAAAPANAIATITGSEDTTDDSGETGAFTVAANGAIVPLRKDSDACGMLFDIMS